MIGKRVGHSLYLHSLSVDQATPSVRALIHKAMSICPAGAAAANVFKVNEERRTVSLLSYPSFFENAFPILLEAWRIDLDSQSCTYRSYDATRNPPVLHRKELLLPPEHFAVPEFAALTSSAEELGLFDDAHLIGTQHAWDAVVRRAGYMVQGHRLLPIGNQTDEVGLGEPTDAITNNEILRHRTALRRQSFSAPFHCLSRHGYLCDRHTFFDYGCGYGDDLNYLQSLGLQAEGWDPYYRRDQEIRTADIVNLGFVINVIEDPQERADALRRAFTCATKLLVVSVMLEGPGNSAGRIHSDGCVTRRNTFQHYFSTGELSQYLEAITGIEPIVVAPGVAYVFTDPLEEQRYFQNRTRTRAPSTPRIAVNARPRRSPSRQRKAWEVDYEAHAAVLDQLWHDSLELGRIPSPEESELAQQAAQALGTWTRARRVLSLVKDVAQIDERGQTRSADVLVALSLQYFRRRAPLKKLEPAFLRDIRHFFGSYHGALEQCRELLSRISDCAAINDDCRKAYEAGIGHYEPEDYLQLPTQQIGRLSPLLRVYIACAALLHGDPEGYDLCKIHIRSAKLSLLRYDAFDASAIPVLVERVKIAMRTQHVDIFAYGEEFPPPPLIGKSIFLGPGDTSPQAELQREFDRQFANDVLTLAERKPASRLELHALLVRARRRLSGLKLAPANDIPKLDAPCGRHFKFRDLIQCGETQQTTQLDNLPSRPESYNALHSLAMNVLDPLIDYFGMIRLTYGFCGHELAKHIKGRIAPRIDQHSCHELSGRGGKICARGGAAVDFLVEDEDMLEVALWAEGNTPFDRIYYYGRDRPLHISWSETPVRQIWEMRPTKNGRVIPRRMRIEGIKADRG